MNRATAPLFVGLVLAARAVAGVPQAPVLETVAVVGNPAPGAPAGLRFRSIDGIVNARGQVVVDGVLWDSTRGIWLREASGALVPVAIHGDALPDATVLVGPTRAALDDEGRIVFGSQAGGALWRWEGPGPLLSLLRVGEQAPDAPQGAVFDLLGTSREIVSSYLRPPAIGDDRELVFPASLAGIGVEGELDDDGIWARDASGRLRLVAREQDPAPGGGRFVALDRYGRFSSNGRGEVALLATVAEPGGAAVSTLFGPGEYGELVRRVAVGDPAPGAPAGVSFTRLEDEGLNDRGEVVLRGTLSSGGNGIWLSRRSGELFPVAMRGDPTPGAPIAAQLGSLQAPMLSDGGHVVFTEGQASQGASRYALWRWHERSGLELVVVGGDRLPGGWTLPNESLELVAVNEHGDLVYAANGDRLDASSGRLLDRRARLVVYDVAGGKPIVLVRTGQPFETRPGLVRLATTYFYFPSLPAHGRSRMNAAGDVIFVVAFSSAVTDDALVLARVFADADADADGVRDLVDRCPVDPDPEQADRDADGVGDACNDADDRDGDDFADAVDNCVDLANDQRDGDGDGRGDECDPFPADPDDEKALLGRDLALAEEALGLAFAELGLAHAALDGLEAELQQCLARRVFADGDGDGEDDQRDACPETPLGNAVDGAGCSLPQYCGGFFARATCQAADWRNDEALGAPRDCRFRAGACVPYRMGLAARAPDAFLHRAAPR